MSTAIVSQFYEDPFFGDAFFKNGLDKQQVGMKNLEKRAVGSPVLNSSILRRNSSNSTTNSHSLLSPKLSLGLNILTTSSSCSSSSSSSSSTSSNGEHRRLDRSMSEPVDRCQQQQNKANQANSSRYKTELCRPFEENGSCKYGDKCQFAHGGHELRNLARHPKYKTELCRTFHTIGFCPYGPRCHFIHNPDESRKSADSPPASPQSTSPTTRRPKALSVGSFNSLGSTGDPSPPSSLSESPTSFGSFFNEDQGVFSPLPTTPTAQNAFSFSHDFASLVSPTGCPSNMYLAKKRLLTATASLDRFNNNNNSVTVANKNQKNSGFSDLDSHIYDSIMKFSGLDNTVGGGNKSSSPVESLLSEIDALNISGGNEIGQAPLSSPMSCASQMDLNRGSARLGLHFPMLNRLACGED